jgi:Spy/CpxP family protein refolding chaperone
MLSWWKHRHGGCGAEMHADSDCGPGWHGRRHPHSHHEDPYAQHASHDGGDFGAFGVRRPLRFLAYKLGLDEPQVGELAKILNELKTERAQAAVDHRRTVAGFADALEGEAFDEAKAREAAAERVRSAERLRDAVVKALSRIHAILQPPQRAQLAYMIRTGALLI